MQYTDLTRKELQREYSRLTRKYTDFIRQPVELDLTTEDPLPGCANRRAVKHFGTVLDKELRDTGAAHPAQAPDAVAALATMPGCAHRTVELCRKAGVRFDTIDHCTVLARTIPEDIRSDELNHVASIFAISARMAALERLRKTDKKGNPRLSLQFSGEHATFSIKTKGRRAGYDSFGPCRRRRALPQPAARIY